MRVESREDVYLDKRKQDRESSATFDDNFYFHVVCKSVIAVQLKHKSL